MSCFLFLSYFYVVVGLLFSVIICRLSEASHLTSSRRSPEVVVAPLEVELFVGIGGGLLGLVRPQEKIDLVLARRLDGEGVLPGHTVGEALLDKERLRLDGRRDIGCCVFVTELHT